VALHASRAARANAKEVEALVKLVAGRFGRLDILVNNAGVFATDQVHDRANNLPELDRLFAVNVGGVAAAVQTAAPLMEKGGRIISIGSVVRDPAPFPGIGHFSPTNGP